MSRWTIPLAWAASERVGDLDRQLEQSRPSGSGLPTMRCFERLALQELHRDEGPALVLVDVVDRADVRVVERRGGRASRWKRSRASRSLPTALRAGTSGRRRGRAWCPRPCRRHPCRRRRASRGCGSARRSGRSWALFLLSVGESRIEGGLLSSRRGLVKKRMPFRRRSVSRVLSRRSPGARTVSQALQGRRSPWHQTFGRRGAPTPRHPQQAYRHHIIIKDATSQPAGIVREAGSG